MKEGKKLQPENLAFPGDSKCNAGLTKREYFAAMAMQAWITANFQDTLEIAPNNIDHNLIAELAFYTADAMIEEAELYE